ncbi:hypothetical protein CR513_47730, partial [Mucuna pruriens]
MPGLSLYRMAGSSIVRSTRGEGAVIIAFKTGERSKRLGTSHHLKNLKEKPLAKKREIFAEIVRYVKTRGWKQIIFLFAEPIAPQVATVGDSIGEIKKGERNSLRLKHYAHHTNPERVSIPRSITSRVMSSGSQSERIDIPLPKSRNPYTLRVGELGNMEAEFKRETIPVKVKTLRVVVLRHTFEGNFGKILDLVEIEVQPEAISTLAQFYDPPMRSFLFMNFQIAPTLEEYECIIGGPRVDRPPYLYQGNWPSSEKIARLLKVLETKILEEDNNTVELMASHSPI